MTLESVFNQWANSITTDGSSRSIPDSISAAKLPSLTGYIKCVLDNTTDTTAVYPFKVEVVPADGKGGTGAGSGSSVAGYVLDLSTDDTKTAWNTATSSSGDEGSGVNVIPVNNTLMKAFMSADWVTGSAASFESARSNDTIW